MLDAVTGWDWFVGIVLLLSVGIGVMRGLVRTVFALAAWVVALLAVPLAGPPLARALPDVVPNAVSYLAVFLLLFVAVRTLGALAAKALRGIGLGGADRLLGAALGVVRAAILILVVAVGAHLAGYSKHPAWKQAQSRPLLDALVQWAEPFLPERLSGVRRT
ncbi:MAG TPA: CvpA family protein [Burkholderiaceae bacterium]|nr:CvpA family protein [Burkholderiaceae bacterium]